jgi:cell division transport system permease protein
MNRRIEKPGADSAAMKQAETTRGPDASARGRIWIDQHLYSAVSSLGRLWQRRAATILTVLVMGLALALPLLLFLVLANAQRFGGTLTDSRDLNAFLAPERNAASARETLAAARALPDVADAHLRSPDDGLSDLRQLAGFSDAIDLLQDNPLPYVLVATPPPEADDTRIRLLAAKIEALPGVAFVQYDLTWRERLNRALALAARVLLLIGALLALGALLVVGNTIRLDVAARADEIAVVQLLGGTRGFVRRPFLYTGMWYGALAALVALGAVMFSRLLLAGPVAQLAQSYGSAFRLQGLSFEAVVATLAAGIMLGWLGAWVACGRELARGTPR